MDASPDLPPRALRLLFEWGGGCLWPSNDAARDALDVGPVEDVLPLSGETQARLEELSAWHDTALNWDDPAGPGPWTDAEAARFDAAALALVAVLRAELGPGYAVTYAPL